MRTQVFVIVAILGVVPSAITQSAKPVLPVFEVDPNFPVMPEKMLLGGVGGATADSHGNVWVFHRPHTLEEDNATLNGYAPAPPVLQFSATGRYIQGWGGPTKSGQYEWFNRGGLFSAHVECESCTTERRRNGDGQILKFTKDGKFLLQIGKGGVKPDSSDTTHLSRR